jgi:hypothetical protein
MTNREHIMQEFAKMSDAEFERVVLDATGGQIIKRTYD